MIYEILIRGVIVLNTDGSGASPQAQAISLARGGDYEILCFVVDQLGIPFDLTDYACTLGVRASATAPTPILARLGVIEDAKNGLVSFRIAQADTKDRDPCALFYDVWITDDDDEDHDRFLAVPWSPFTITPAATLPGDAIDMPQPNPYRTERSGFVDFTAGGETSADIVFADGFEFPSAYAIELSAYGAAGIVATAGPREGDDAPPAGPAASGFRISVSVAFDGRVFWYART